MTIFKYPIKVADEQIIEMPLYARILCVQVQHDAPCLWAMVDENSEKSGRRILTVGTGHDARHCDFNSYIGTYQMLDGVLVWHVFDGGLAA